jgi:hypothetical protein
MKASQYAKLTGKETAEVLEMFGLTHHAQSIPDGVELPEEPAAEVKPVEKDDITFYWRDGRNASFLANGKLYKSENSILRLSLKKDGPAIAYLKQHKTNNANGGIEFGEFEIDSSGKSDGSAIDKLLAMDVKTMASMLGRAYNGESRGVLIGELLGLKG